jgi:3-hydroxyisobutyrate dehydrogenase-like beta-hydroxyacid dehydrogenase
MGKPMAGNLIRAGFSLTVHNRSRGPVDELVALGAGRAQDLSDLARSSDCVLSCLPAPADVRKVLTDAFAGAREGTIFIDLSTVDPATSRDLAAEAEARGIKFLDAPVSGGVSGAEAGTLTVMVGGDRKVFDRCEPLLSSIGKRIYYLGPAGSGSLAKLCNQLLAGVGYAAVAEATALARKGGLDLAILYELLSVSSGRSRALEQAAPLVLAGEYDATFALNLAAKDLECVVLAAEELGLSLRLAPLARDIHQEARALGLGEKDQAAVVVSVARRSGIEAG